MKKKFIAIFICLSISVFAVEKPDILDDYKIIVGMIEDIYINLTDLKERQVKLENKFNKIRVVNKDNSTSTSSYQSIKLSEATREELLNNLR